MFEMLLTYARAFTVTAASLEYGRGQINALILQGEYDALDASGGVGQMALQSLGHVRELCERVNGLGSIVSQIDRISQKVEVGVLPLVLYTDMEALQHAIMDALKEHYYYPVTAANAQLYQTDYPFGEVVGDAFPSAGDDIRDATQCHVLGQPTACAFHLMRSIEVALRCFAKKLKVEYRPTWDAYCNAIDKALSKPHKDKTPSERKQEPRYREILGDLMAVKLAWRNPTMHVERRYEPHEALQVFIATGILLDRLATAGVREKRSRKVAELSDGSRPALIDPGMVLDQ
jgi:hypothetical protein